MDAVKSGENGGMLVVLAVGSGLQPSSGHCDTMARATAVVTTNVLGYTGLEETNPVVSDENGRMLVVLAVGAGVVASLEHHDAIARAFAAAKTSVLGYTTNY